MCAALCGARPRARGRAGGAGRPSPALSHLVAGGRGSGESGGRGASSRICAAETPRPRRAAETRPHPCSTARPSPPPPRARHVSHALRVRPRRQHLFPRRPPLPGRIRDRGDQGRWWAGGGGGWRAGAAVGAARLARPARGSAPGRPLALGAMRPCIAATTRRRRPAARRPPLSPAAGAHRAPDPVLARRPPSPAATVARPAPTPASPAASWGRPPSGSRRKRVSSSSRRSASRAPCWCEWGKRVGGWWSKGRGLGGRQEGREANPFPPAGLPPSPSFRSRSPSKRSPKSTPTSAAPCRA